VVKLLGCCCPCSGMEVRKKKKEKMNAPGGCPPQPFVA